MRRRSPVPPRLRSSWAVSIARWGGRCQARLAPGRRGGETRVRMRLDARGHPLHTRALSVVLTARADGKLDVHGTVLDLRKRGFVPVAGDLQGAGVIHDMRLAGTIDPASATLAGLTAEQRSVAFEPSAVTGGESCRDPIDRIAALAGTRLDDGWARRLGDAIGGPRGRSPPPTLRHLLGSSAAWALERGTALHGARPARPAGQRVFQAPVLIDGHEREAARVQLSAQTSDLHFAPAGAVARPMDRFAEQLEVRLVAEVEFPTLTVGRLEAAERRRGAADLERAAWRDRSGAIAWLIGRRLGAGVTAELLTRLGAVPDDRPLLDTLLMLAPALVQCAAAMSHAWPLAFRTDPSVVAMGGLTDSCYMWRQGGGLDRARAAEGNRPPWRS